MMMTSKRTQRDELVKELRKRSGNSFPRIYSALQAAAAKQGGSHKLSREAVFKELDAKPASSK